MAKTYTKMMIDVTENINSIATAVQMDTQSRYLDVYLYNNGLPIDLTNEVVRINIRKPDGTTLFNQGEVTDATEGRCQFELTNDILADAKPVDAQISIWSNEGQILSTKAFKIYISESLRNDEEVEASNEFGVLVVLFTEIQNALDLMNAMVDNFGRPSAIATQYGATTFWQMLEALAQTVDTRQMLKLLVNDTIDTDYFLPISKMISDVAGTDEFVPLNILLGNLMGGKITFVTNGTWTVPEGITKILITACGGGGGGGAAPIISTSAVLSGGGGGGAACIQQVAYNVTPGDEIQITIGLGGKGGSYDRSNSIAENGNDGGATVIGTLVTLPGGVGGASADNGGSGGLAGGTGGGNGGAYGTTSGSNGDDGLLGLGGNGGTDPSSTKGGAGGGGGSYGDGGDGGAVSWDATITAGRDGGRGAGGGGGSWGALTNAPGNGGNGGNGIVIIEWGL